MIGRVIDPHSQPTCEVLPRSWIVSPNVGGVRENGAWNSSPTSRHRFRPCARCSVMPSNRPISSRSSRGSTTRKQSMRSRRRQRWSRAARGSGRRSRASSRPVLPAKPGRTDSPSPADTGTSPPSCRRSRARRGPRPAGRCALASRSAPRQSRRHPRSRPQSTSFRTTNRLAQRSRSRPGTPNSIAPCSTGGSRRRSTTRSVWGSRILRSPTRPSTSPSATRPSPSATRPSPSATRPSTTRSCASCGRWPLISSSARRRTTRLRC